MPAHLSYMKPLLVMPTLAAHQCWWNKGRMPSQRVKSAPSMETIQPRYPWSEVLTPGVDTTLVHQLLDNSMSSQWLVAATSASHCCNICVFSLWHQCILAVTVNQPIRWLFSPPPTQSKISSHTYCEGKEVVCSGCSLCATRALSPYSYHQVLLWGTVEMYSTMG